MTENGIPFPEDKLGTNLGDLPEEAEEESKEDEIRKADLLLAQALATVES